MKYLGFGFFYRVSVYIAGPAFVLFCMVASPFSFGEAIELKEGDRVVFLGDTFFERASRYGHIEAALTANWADRKITFRNLGWSGDGPSGRARAFFGDVEEGFGNLKSQLARYDPSVVFAYYGAMDSFAGEEGLQPFMEDFEKLLAAIDKPGRRIVLLTLTPREKMAGVLDDAASQNRKASLFANAVRGIGQAGELTVIDLFEALRKPMASGGNQRLTDNGVHLNDFGYQLAAAAILDGMDENWRGKAKRFRKRDTEWVESLYAAIEEKNEYVFNQWRPQNETYLRGFRKHEQGQNAAELKAFDTYIEATEAMIKELIEAGNPAAVLGKLGGNSK